MKEKIKSINICIVLIYATVVCTLFLLAINCVGITEKIVGAVYPEYTIAEGNFLDKRIDLKDFSVKEDGSILSETVDPWIYISFQRSDMKNLLFLDIDIEYADNEGETVQMYYVDSYQYQTFPITKGWHHEKLLSYTEETHGIRLDLTAQSQQKIKITRIVFNESEFLTNYFCEKAGRYTVWLLFLGCIYVIINFTKKDKHINLQISDTSKKEILCLLGVLQIVCLYTGIFWFAGIIFLLMVYIYNSLLELGLKNSKISNVSSVSFYFILMIGFVYQISGSVIYLDKGLSNKIYLLVLFVYTWFVIGRRCDIFITILLYAMCHGYILYVFTDTSINNLLKYHIFNANFAFNILLVTVILVTIQRLVGKNIGNLIFCVFFTIYFTANLIKIKYQNGVLSKADLALINEVIGIADQYVGVRELVLVAVICIVIIVCVVKYRKKLKTYFKLEFHVDAMLFAVIVMGLISGINQNTFRAIGLDTDSYYPMSNERVKAYGFAVYSLLEFSGDNNEGVPEGYSAEIKESVAKYAMEQKKEAIEPTVILILAESLFEVQSIPDITFNKELTSTLKQYKVADIISSSYGGRTAAAELEALTGLTNLFFDGDVIAYTSYLNKKGNMTGSLAREFASEGYATYAIHANRADYYNRDIVYENMGFSDFISKEDFVLDKEDLLGDGLVSDEAFFDRMIEILEDSNRPTFIFGASLEGHSPYNAKYKSTDLVAYSDKYDENILDELENYAQTVYNFDKQMARLIQYFEEKQEPVLIYIFGDHLPALQINDEDGYLEDIRLKYKTPLYAYSNYCDVTIEEEYISLNQIAPEILRLSGIRYNPYFDYICNLRKQYPVIHKEVITDVMTEELQMYNKIQWDLLFGEKYLLKE